VLEFLAQRKAALLLGALLVAMLALMRHDLSRSGAATPIEKAVARVSDPLVHGGASAVEAVEKQWSSLSELRGLRERSAALAREVETLRGAGQSWESERRENERLRRLLDLRTEITVPSIAARIAATSHVEERTILLDRGTADGLRPGLPVIAADGVLGQIVFTSDHLARVLLITDPTSGVAVVHQDGRFQGVVTGRGDGPCELLYVPRTAKLAPGDLLVTSGLDQVFPRGLPVGRVVALRPAPDGTREIEVRPEASADSVEEVLVLRMPPAAGA